MKTIVFDFDGTLTCYAIPHYPLLYRAGYPEEEAPMLACASQIMREHGLNQYEALYYMVFDSVEKLDLPADDSSFCLGADQVRFRPGAVALLRELSASARLCVLTCGYANFIRRTAAAPYLSEIVGSSFAFSEGRATGTREVLADTRKGEKLDELAGDNYRDLIYLGDGPTDLSAFAHVLENGGCAVLVHAPGDFAVVRKLLELGLDGVQVFEADYTPGSDLHRFLTDAVR